MSGKQGTAEESKPGARGLLRQGRERLWQIDWRHTSASLHSGMGTLGSAGSIALP